MVCSALLSELSALTHELLSTCRYCVEIVADERVRTPVQCTKWSGSSFPISLSVVTCLSCREFESPPQNTTLL
jgi:hypothetical protein